MLLDLEKRRTEGVREQHQRPNLLAVLISIGMLLKRKHKERKLYVNNGKIFSQTDNNYYDIKKLNSIT